MQPGVKHLERPRYYHVDHMYVSCWCHSHFIRAWLARPVINPNMRFYQDINARHYQEQLVNQSKLVNCSSVTDNNVILSFWYGLVNINFWSFFSNFAKSKTTFPGEHFKPIFKAQNALFVEISKKNDLQLQ